MARENADSQTALNTTKWYRDAQALYLEEEERFSRGQRHLKRCPCPHLRRNNRQKLTFENRYKEEAMAVPRAGSLVLEIQNGIATGELTGRCDFFSFVLLIDLILQNNFRFLRELSRKYR